MKRFVPLFLAAAGVAAPASAQVVNRVIGYTPPGQAYVNYSWGQVGQQYDANGDAQDLLAGGDATFQRAAVGLSYDVARAGALGVYVGGEFAMASAKAAYGSGSNVTLESGFKPQAATILAGVRGPAYSLKAGYMADLGPDPEVRTLDLSTGSPRVTGGDIANSDGNDAVVLGGEFYSPFAGLTVTGGATYYLTLKKDATVTLPAIAPVGFTGGEVTLRDYNPADYLDLHLGVGYRASDILEVGLQARYLKRFEGEFTTSSATPNIPRAVYNGLSRGDEEAGYALGFVPYLTLSPQSLPVQLTLSGSTTREYAPYGFTAIGENSPVGRRGVTATLRFGF